MVYRYAVIHLESVYYMLLHLFIFKPISSLKLLKFGGINELKKKHLLHFITESLHKRKHLSGSTPSSLFHKPTILTLDKLDSVVNFTGTVRVRDAGTVSVPKTHISS